MEWIGLIAGAIAAVCVAALGLISPQKESQQLKQLAEARKMLDGTDSESGSEIDQAMDHLAARISSAPIRRRDAVAITGLSILMGGLATLIVATALQLSDGLIDDAGFRILIVAAFTMVTLGLLIGGLWLLNLWLKSD